MPGYAGPVLTPTAPMILRRRSLPGLPNVIAVVAQGESFGMREAEDEEVADPEKT